MSILDKVFPGKPDRADFAQMVTRAFREAGIEKVEPVEGDFALKIGDGATVFLGNLYSNYCAASRSVRRAVLSEFVAAAASIPSLPSIPSDFASAKPSLMPVIRDAAYYSMTHLMNRKAGKPDPAFDVVVKDLVAGLVIGLAYDTERNITSLNREHFDLWRVSLEEAFKAAKENLWEKTDPSRFAGQNGVYWGEWHDSYDSSRLLLTEVIYRLSVDGDPVAFIPNRDQLWVTGTNNVEGLAALLKAGVQTHFKHGHPLSPDLYVLLDGNWKLYVPEDQSLRNLLLPLRRQRDAIDYAEQQALLNDIHKIEDVDVFVSSYKIYEKKDGTAYSACVWTNGIDSSLPRAENIAFLVDQEGKEHYIVPWDAAVSVVGDLLEKEADLTPVRYRVRDFPSAQQMSRLRRLAKGWANGA
jgi:hypothetical protein